MAVHLTYGGLGTGDDFGEVRIRNLGTSACRLTGEVTVEPMTSDLKPVKPFGPWVHQFAAVDLVLAAHGGRPQADIMLGGEERDDPLPPHGSCPSRAEVVPAYWRVRAAGQALDVRNADPTSANGGNSTIGAGPGIYACLGNFLNASFAPSS